MQANTSHSGELPRVRSSPELPRRPVSLTANDASTTSPLPHRPQASTTDDDAGAARMSRGEAGGRGLLRTWSYGGHASLDRAGEAEASMPTELLGTPISRAGYLPDLEPLIMGSRSGVFRSFSTPSMGSPSVNDPPTRGGGACCAPRMHSAPKRESTPRTCRGKGNRRRASVGAADGGH